MRTLLLSILVLSGFAPAAAQKTIKDVNMSIPTNSGMAPYLNKEQLGKLVGMPSDKDSAGIKNMFDGITAVDSIGDNYAKIRMNKNTNWQMCLLPQKDSAQIICIIKTLDRPSKESNVEFYNTDWTSVKSQLGLPDCKNAETMIGLLTEKPDSMSENDFEILKSEIEPVFVNADMSKDGYTITYRLALSLVPNDKIKDVNSIIKQISFKWDGVGFKKCE